VLPSPTKSPSPKLPLSAPLDIHAASAEHPSLRFPEVRAATAVLQAVGGLRPPPFSPWRADQGLMDWLDAFFGFQRDNIRNKREHLVLLLANAQMCLSSSPTRRCASPPRQCVDAPLLR
jgi:callose synthase